MAKEKEQTTEKTETIEPGAIVLAPENLPAIGGSHNDEFLSKAESISTGSLQEITAAYYDLKEDSTVHGIFCGMSDMTTTDKETGEMTLVPVVRFETKEGKFIHGGKVLVNACRNLPVPSYIRIVTRKMEKGNKGKYMDMNVYTLPVQ